MNQNKLPKPYVQIIEQPDSKGTRFRYACERRLAGPIPGVSSFNKNKTFPAIKVVGYKGKAIVVVSCVTKDEPYRPHPHSLVGREGCKKGVCTMEINDDSMTATFTNLGIQCVKKKDLESSLSVREQIRVDPFKTGFKHKHQPASIDLNAVRLCFQVFIYPNGEGPQALQPIVSEPIYDKKSKADLSIVKLSDCVSYVDGGRKDIILLCGKVLKEDIQVRFYEVRREDGEEIWEKYANLEPQQVHRQAAIWFRAPSYHNLDITESVRVFIQLRRPSDGETSQSVPFEYLPIRTIGDEAKRKRQRMEESGNDLGSVLEPKKSNAYGLDYGYNIPLQSVKPEPKDKSPYNEMYVGGYSPEIAKPNTNLIDFNEPDPVCENITHGMELLRNNIDLRNHFTNLDSTRKVNSNTKNTSPYAGIIYSEEATRSPYAAIETFPPQIDNHFTINESRPHCSKNTNGTEFSGNNFNVRQNFTDPSGSKVNSNIAMSTNDILLNSHELQNYWPDIDDISTSFSDINIS